MGVFIPSSYSCRNKTKFAKKNIKFICQSSRLKFTWQNLFSKLFYDASILTCNEYPCCIHIFKLVYFFRTNTERCFEPNLNFSSYLFFSQYQFKAHRLTQFCIYFTETCAHSRTILPSMTPSAEYLEITCSARRELFATVQTCTTPEVESCP